MTAARTDRIWWYRLLNGLWKIAITATTLTALTFIVWWLANNGSYTTDEAEALSTAFTILGNAVMLGMLVGIVDLFGPHAVHNALMRVMTPLWTRLRGVVR